jgi:4-azaleucine resistance transporter AzlC
MPYILLRSHSQFCQSNATGRIQMFQKNTENISEFLYGARDMLPMTIAAAIYGMAFGLLAIQAGFSFDQSVSMSALIFGGSSQLIALDRLSVGAGSFAAIVAGIALNTRFLLVTAAMKNSLIGRPWWQTALGAALATDASVALMQTSKRRQLEHSFWYFFGGGFSLYIVWILVTAIGAILGGQIPNPAAFGLDFAIIAVFIAAIPGLWRGMTDFLPWTVSGITVALIAFLAPEYTSWGLILGAVSGAAFAGVRNGS